MDTLTVGPATIEMPKVISSAIKEADNARTKSQHHQWDDIWDQNWADNWPDGPDHNHSS